MRDARMEKFLGSCTGFTRGVISGNKPDAKLDFIEIMQRDIPNIQEYIFNSDSCENVVNRATGRGKQLDSHIHGELMSMANLRDSGYDIDGGHAVSDPMDITFFDTTQITRPGGGGQLTEAGKPCHTLCASAHTPKIIIKGKMCRCITPEECEGIQGFPAGWTKIPYNGKTENNCPKTPRYKACGNSFAVPVIRFIGQRIEDLEK